jgi:tetratricopeptide (TPR) repeat protein
LAAADALVDELLQLVGENAGHLELLWQASVYPMPVPPEALVFEAQAPGGSPKQEVPAEALDRLAASSLLTRMDGEVFVHRWTAESLKPRMGEAAFRRCCRRGAEYLEWRASSRTHSLTDFLESIRLFLAALEFDRATAVAWPVIAFLQRYGQTTVWTELSREVADALPPGHEEKLRFIGTEGDGLVTLGFTDRALERYRSCVEIAERLAAQEPERADYLRDLSVSYIKMGDMLEAQGQGETARQFYHKALEIAERLVAQEPERADYLRDLSVSYNKMGDLLEALGQGEAARQFYQKALDIRERLAAQEPGRADYLRDLSVSYERMGDLLEAQGQGERARQFYQKALEIAERLAAQEPQRADYAVDLAKSLARMGDRASLERALSILTGLQDSGRLSPWDQGALEAVRALLRQSDEAASTGA